MKIIMTKTYTFGVTGTKCASCEIVIERAIRRLPGVTDVRVSHSQNRLAVTVAEGAVIRTQDLEQAVGAHGYRFFDLAHEAEEKNAERVNYRRLGGVVVVILALYLVLSRTGFLTYSPSVENSGGLGAVFVVGLIAAFSSCTAVVSGLVIAVSTAAAKRQPNRPARQKMMPHFLFNSGRLTGFAAFGALVGLAGSALTLTPTMNALLVLCVAVLMIVLGVNLLDIAPKRWGNVRPPKRLAHAIHRLAESSHPAVPFILGAATFFLPCGFTQSMQLYALSTGNPIQAAFIMSIFALGTMPALLGVGYMSSIAKGRSLNLLTKAAGAFVVVIGLSNFSNGIALMGVELPREQTNVQEPSRPLLVDGKQLIQMEITDDFTYAPDTLTVTAGIPVVWEIYGSDRMGCARTLVSRGLGISAQLQPGMNTIEFTPEKPGRYAFSCSMGMIRGIMIVESSS